MPAITRVFEPQKGEQEAGSLVKKRITIRLLTELFLAGVFTDASVLYSIVKDLVRRHQGCPLSFKLIGLFVEGESEQGPYPTC